MCNILIIYINHIDAIYFYYSLYINIRFKVLHVFFINIKFDVYILQLTVIYFIINFYIFVTLQI